MKTITNKCLFPKCDNLDYTRGLCRKHYASAARYVRNGLTTWPELVAAGKATKAAARHLDGKGQSAKWFLNGD